MEKMITMISTHKVLFTSDTHFGSQRTLDLSLRPFEDVKMMDEVLLKNINESIHKHNADILWHLGDFGDYAKMKYIEAKICLLLGNYEIKEIDKNFNGNFAEWVGEVKKEAGRDDIEVFYGPRILSVDVSKCSSFPFNHSSFIISHDPLDGYDYHETINDYDRDGVPIWPAPYLLFGHIHGRQAIKRIGIDVGVDAHHFYPFTLENVDFLFNAIEEHYDDSVFI